MNKKTISKPYKSLGDSNPNNRPLADDSWSQNKPEPQISRKRHVDTPTTSQTHPVGRWNGPLVDRKADGSGEASEKEFGGPGRMWNCDPADDAAVLTPNFPIFRDRNRNS